jgi:hypothetical protein
MDADDPIPIDATALVDAYQQTRTAYISDWDRLAAGISSDRDDPCWSIDLAERIVERFFRGALAQGELNAYVRDPNTGQRLKLLKLDDWGPASFHPGICSNFTSPNDVFCPGPDSTVHHMRRPVFVITGELKSWLHKIPGAPKKRVGRRPHDWDTIEKRIFKLMDENGDFSLDDPDWNAQARLEDKITDEFGIGVTQLRVRLPDILNRWKSTKAGN